MADDKTETEERKEREKVQLGKLSNAILRGLYAAGRAYDDTQNFGEAGKNAIYQNGYLGALAEQVESENPDSEVSRFFAQSLYRMEIESAKKGGKAGSANITSGALLESAIPYFESAVQSIRLGELLKIMGIEKYKNAQSIAGEYIEDLIKKKDPLAAKIYQSFTSSVVTEEVGKALIGQTENQRKSLEILLNEEPKKEEKKK